MITALDIIENETRMDKLYNPSEAMETYFDQVEDAIEFTEAGNSLFTNTQIITKAFIRTFATRLYRDEFRAWNQLLVPARTWEAFKTIFLTANREIREMQALAGNTGYSKNVTQDLFEQTARALFSIVEFTATDQEVVDNVAAITASMETQLQDCINGMNNIRAYLDAINLSACNGNGNAGCTCTPGGGNNDQSY